MGPMPLNRDTLPNYEARLAALSGDTPRRFGTMTPHAALAHLAFMYRVSVGDLEQRDESIPVVRSIFFLLFFKWFTTWPGGRIKAPPSFMVPPEGTFESEKAALGTLMRRFVDAAEANPGARVVTPLLGAITLRQWQLLHGAHTHHHLRQFGQ